MSQTYVHYCNSGDCLHLERKHTRIYIYIHVTPITVIILLLLLSFIRTQNHWDRGTVIYKC